MFKHILIPIDDSSVSREAARKAIAFAKEAGARVTGYHALPPLQRVYGDGYRFSQPPGGDEMREASQQLIDDAARAAREVGVAFDSLIDHASSPAEGIVAAAEQRNCDAIFIGTHGRRGLAKFALGSVASGLLGLSSVPVVVYR